MKTQRLVLICLLVASLVARPIIETFTLGPLTSTGIISFFRQ